MKKTCRYESLQANVVTFANVNQQMENNLAVIFFYISLFFEELLFVKLLTMTNVLLFVSYFSTKYFMLYIGKLCYFYISYIDDVTGCQCQTKL
jgi:hypothetical protein